MFSVKELMDEAERETRLSDWGDDHFLQPFELLIDSLNQEAELTEIGRQRSQLHLANLLAYRLRLVADRKLRPEIARQHIDKPVFMSGMPRSGTSYLNALLARDPDIVAPLHWQMWCPSPPPNDPAIDHRPQIERGQSLMDAQGFEAADIKDKHSYGAMHAEEDSHILEYSFVSGAFAAWWDVPTYVSYVYGADFTPAYRIHKRILQALQIGKTSKRWLLKAPDHFIHVNALLSVYPDACFILNHRDPSKVMASVMSLMAAHRRQFGNRPLQQDRQFALAFIEFFAAGMENLIRMRADPEFNRRFVDISFRELERDPIGQVRRVYAHLDMELVPSVVASMERHIAENRKGKFGNHVYRLGDYAVTSDEVRERFRQYLKYFDISSEPDA
jgi:hypothetical protein